MARLFLRISQIAAVSLALFGGIVHAADNRNPADLIKGKDRAAEQAEIAALVRALGAPTFAARQQAQRALVGFGVQAKDALEAACHDPDQEIQKRARVALAAIHDVDFYIRLGAFLADKNPADGHGLAGWDRYRACAGASGPARRLFADMQRAERELLELVEHAPRQAGDLLDARCQQTENAAQGADAEHQPPLSLATIAAIVFAAGEADVPVSGHAGNCIVGFSSQAALSQALNSKQMAPVMRGLLGTWVKREFDRESVTGYRSLIMAMQYNLKEAIAPALADIEPPGGPPHLEQYAILAVGKLGGREHVPTLLPLLNDSRPVGVPDRTGRESDTQIRDVALAAMIHLTGQKLADYGFVHAKTNPLILFNTNTLGFSDANAREQALSKWRAWWDEHGP